MQLCLTTYDGEIFMPSQCSSLSSCILQCYLYAMQRIQIIPKCISLSQKNCNMDYLISNIIQTSRLVQMYLLIASNFSNQSRSKCKQSMVIMQSELNFRYQEFREELHVQQDNKTTDGNITGVGYSKTLLASKATWSTVISSVEVT